MMRLLKDEKVLEVLSPHPFSFWPYYLFFLYYILVGGYMYTKYDDLLRWVQNSLINNSLIAEIIVVALWWIILIVPAVIFSLLNVTYKWVVLYTLVIILGTWALITNKMPLDQIWIITAGLGVLGFIFTELYRRAHKYYLTNKRIIMGVFSPIFGSWERDLLYSKITDVTFKQGILGKIFNYGTVIPTTASGLGTGVDTATAAVGTGVGAGKGGVSVGGGVAIAGSRGIVSPHGRSWFILYGVPDPGRIKELIFSQMASREEAQYLQRQVELLEKLVEEKEGGKKE